MAVQFDLHKANVHKLQQGLFEKCLDIKQPQETLSWGLDLSKGWLYVFFGARKREKQVFHMEIMGTFDSSEKTFTWSWCQFPGHLTRCTSYLRRMGKKRKTWKDLLDPVIQCDFQLIKEYALWISFLGHFSFYLILEMEKDKVYVVLCKENP